MPQSPTVHHPKTIYTELAILQQLQAVLAVESAAIARASAALPPQLIVLTQKLAHGAGRIIFTGMGKSGYISRKLAATFSSLGMPAIFLHPAEALHGDLGMVASGDICIILSKSGMGAELATLIPHLRSAGVYCALLCCREGKLASLVDTCATLPFNHEACLHNLAPSASSTLMLAIGDALAIVASSIRGFAASDFAALHPSGALGNSLLLDVASLMHTGDELPMLAPTNTFSQLLLTITKKKKGVGIVAHEGRLLGIITDGDLRRALQDGAAVFTCSAREIMSPSPITISPDMPAYDALQIMEAKEVTALVVTAQQKVVGLVHIHDLVKAGITR